MKVAILILISLSTVSGQDGVYSTTLLDGSQIRSFYRSVRDFAMWMIGHTGRRTRGAFLQGTEGHFPCNLTSMRSSTVPTNVHRLRPGTEARWSVSVSILLNS